MPAPILYADDSRTSQALVEGFLSKLGYVTITVQDGLAAVEQAGRSKWHAILMDMRMPKLDGIAATGQIRALPKPFNTVPIIGLTAASDQEIGACINAGMDLVLSKPIDFGQLAEVLSCLDFAPPQVPAPAPVFNTAAQVPQIINVLWLNAKAEDVGKSTLREAFHQFREEGPALIGAIALAATARDKIALEFNIKALSGVASDFGGERLARTAAQCLTRLSDQTDWFLDIAQPMTKECATLLRLLEGVLAETAAKRG